MDCHFPEASPAEEPATPRLLNPGIRQEFSTQVENRYRLTN